MANWFKVYETDMDESRLKYALDKLPETGWVWFGILSECCKHRSDTIRWSDKAHELFGFSDRLKVSIPKVNEAINLLCEIDYISRDNGHIKVLKWNDKQSDYCRRKEAGDYSKNGQYPIVSDNIGEYPLEERRGEESRREESTCAPISKKFKKPAIEEVELHGDKIGLPKTECAAFFNYYESKGWVVGRTSMKSWPHALAGWKVRWESSGRVASPQKRRGPNI